MEHHYQDLITLFDACFFEKYQTRLVKGDDEPLYLPANEDCPYHQLFFAHGFFASALHESAHWLIAGEDRRKLIDFGYWYVPEGRNASQQQQFLQVEVKPQALECILATACQFPFRISLDNLNGSEADTTAFKQAVQQQVNHYGEIGLPHRAKIFHQALCHFYGTPCEAVGPEFIIT